MMSEHSIVSIVVAVIGALAAVAVALISGRANRKSKGKTQNRRRSKAGSRSEAPAFERAIARLLVIAIYGVAGFFGLTAILAFSDGFALMGASLIVAAAGFALPAHFLDESLSQRP